MSQLEMALGGLTHSTQPPDNCWSSTAWEHQNLTDSGSLEGGGGGGGGEYSSSRIDWDIKTSWEWDNLTTVYPGRRGDGGSAAGSQQQQQTSNEWANGACSAVTLATSSMDFSIGLASGSSSASGMSVSSGIPGLAASRGSSGADISSLVKSEPDEINNGMEKHQQQQLTTVLGTPATSSALEHRHQRRLFISLGGGSDRESEVLERRSEEPKPSEIAQQSNGGGSVAGGGGADSLNMGLKLGRRTYFEDSVTGGVSGGGGGQVTKGSTPALSPPGKKQGTVSSPSTQIARCQVEGCKADLSSCKDYHRRHKVCEMHSKASRAMAAGIEQRFCQQCSRFHVLTEFDEEKRSCRRRLAGHNERRRKPHVDTHHHGIGLRSPSPLHSDTSSLGLDGASLYLTESKRLSFLSHNRSFEDDGQYTNSLKHTNPWSLERRDNGGLQSQLQIQSAERQQQQCIFSGSRPPTADRLLMLLQSPKTQMSASNPSTNGLAMGGGHHHFLERPLGPLGQGLSLSSSTGGVFGSLEQQQQQHGVVSSCSQSLSSVSGLSTDSGRALSRLSSQSWATCPPPRAPAPPLVDPLDLPPQPANSTLEQLVAGRSEHSNRGPSPFSYHHLQLPPGGPSSTSNHHQQQHQSYDKLFRMQSGSGLNNSMGLNCGNDQIRGTNNNNNNFLAGLGGYEGPNSMIALLQGGHEYEPLSSGPASNHHHVRPTIDLMQMPSAHQVPPHNGAYSHAQVPSGQYNEFTSLRPFESSIFSTQQML